MKKEVTFYKCNVCGNFVEMIKDSGVKMVCCGQEMELQVPNTSDGANEKHLPIGSLEGDCFTVTISTVLHPMLYEHHICWISILQGDKIQRVCLNETGEPKASFKVGEGDITMYEYCNLHGLWTSTFKKI